MTEETLPADWAIEGAFRRAEYSWTLSEIKAFTWMKDLPAYKALISLARMIEKHEKPPVDPDLLLAREIGNTIALDHRYKGLAKQCLNGDVDKTAFIEGVLAGIRKGRELSGNLS